MNCEIIFAVKSLYDDPVQKSSLRSMVYLLKCNIKQLLNVTPGYTVSVQYGSLRCGMKGILKAASHLSICIRVQIHESHASYERCIYAIVGACLFKIEECSTLSFHYYFFTECVMNK